MNNYFFKFLVLFVIVLTFLYVFNNTKEFFTEVIDNCDLSRNIYSAKRNQCSQNPSDMFSPKGNKKIDIIKQFKLITDPLRENPNTHNVFFSNGLDLIDDKLIIPDRNYIYIPNFTSYVLFAEFSFSVNDFQNKNTLISSNNWSLDVETTGKLVLNKLNAIGNLNTIVIIENVTPLAEYKVFIKCNKISFEIYTNNDKIFIEDDYLTNSILFGTNLSKTNFYNGYMKNITLFNYKPDSIELGLLEIGKKLLPERLELIGRSNDNIIELNWLIDSNESRDSTDFYIIQYENGVGPKLIKYINKVCDNCNYKFTNLKNFAMYKFAVVGVNDFGVGQISNFIELSPGTAFDKFNIPTRGQKVNCLDNGLFDVSNRCKVTNDVLPNFNIDKSNYILNKINQGSNAEFALTINE